MLLSTSSASNSLKLPSSSIVVGSEFKMSNIDWLCVHEDTNCLYLMTKYILGSIIFGGVSYGSYPRSQLFLACSLFAISLGIYGNPNFKSRVVGGVAGYCHPATLEEVSGEFSYFTDDASRLATDESSTGSTYWLASSVNGNVWYLISDRGAIVRGTTSNASSQGYFTNCHGFRPVVAMKK